MKLTEKLIGFLYRKFSKDPEQFLALRIRSEGFLAWSVADGVLTVTTAQETSVFQLSQYTLASLANALAGLSGVDVLYMAPDNHLSARVLLDGGANQDDSNGDHLYGYGSLLWAYMEPVAVELMLASQQIANMIKQLSVKTAQDVWLDEWGGYFGIPRNLGETDQNYGSRIIVEVLRPRGNNKAIEAALLEHFGQPATVVDIVKWKNAVRTYSGAVNHDGTWHYDATHDPILGLFQVVIGYDLLTGSDQETYAASVRAFIERFRDAGTQLDSLALSGSSLSDAVPAASTDTAAGLTITRNAYFSGAYTYGGAATFAGTAVTSEYLP